MDVNDHAYTGRLPRRLAEPDLFMTEQFLATNGFEAPNSHFLGQRPISGCYCTQGIDCVNVFVSPHAAGAGDHRYWVWTLLHNLFSEKAIPILFALRADV